MVEDIISLGLDSRGNTIQESSTVITIADAVITTDIIADAVITAKVGIVNNSCTWYSNQHE